jgi:hemoglobin
LKKSGKTLYERLGGYDGIAAIVTDYLGAVRADPRFSRFGSGRRTDKKLRDFQLNIDHVCKLAGGSNYYMGRDMKTAHAGLGINDDEWKANIKHLEQALGKHRVPRRESGAVVSLF